MSPSAEMTLVDARGRKYLTAEERTRFLAAVRHPPPAHRADARAHAGNDRMPHQRGPGAATMRR